MAKIKDIIEKTESHAPLETQEQWDNSGWQINLGLKETKNVMLALNVTENVIEQAIKKKCNLIISHHPMIFCPLKNITDKAIIKAIQNNIQIYSAHTNFDKAKNGTTAALTQTLKSVLELKNIKDINDYTKIAKLKTPLNIQDFNKKIKAALNLKSVKISNPHSELYEIKTVAFCAGSGGEFITQVQAANADCFITSDIKYHQALESKIIIADIGHFESEIISLQSLKKIIEMPDLNIFFAKEEPVFEVI